MTNKLLTDYGDGMTENDIVTAVALFKLLKRDFTLLGDQLGCKFDGFQVGVTSAPMPLFTDNMSKNTRAVKIPQGVGQLLKKELAEVRLQHMKRKGA